MLNFELNKENLRISTYNFIEEKKNMDSTNPKILHILSYKFAFGLFCYHCNNKIWSYQR